MHGYCEAVNHSPCIIVCTIGIREGVGLYMLPGGPQKRCPRCQTCLPRDLLAPALLIAMLCCRRAARLPFSHQNNATPVHPSIK